MRLPFLLLSLIPSTISVTFLEPGQNWEIPTTENLFTGMMFSSRSFRIPAVAYLHDNTILAVSDIRYNNAGDLPNKIGVVARRRFTDGSWTSGYLISGLTTRNVGDGDCAVIVDRKTGAIFALWSGDKGFQGGPGSISTAENPAHVYFTRSFDNGVSWEDKHDITHFIYSHLCTECSDFRKNMPRLFVTSGAGCQLRDGSLVFACLANDLSGNHDFVLITEDFGDTWTLKEGPTAANSDEAKLVELNNGDLLISIRQNYCRYFQYSKTRGDDWYKGQIMTNVTTYRTNGEIRRMTSVIDGFEKNRLIHTLVYFNNLRRNVSIAVSYDEGDTWPYRKSLETFGSAYSAFDISKDGEIYVFYEKDAEYTYDMNMAKVTLDWLTDGFDHYEKPKHLNWCLVANQDEENPQCPEDSYQFNYRVFDSYVESYILYPLEMDYTFTQPFRDFTINLTHEGLNRGTYNNLNPTKFTVRLVGDSPTKRVMNFNNIDVIMSSQLAKQITFFITNGNLIIEGAQNMTIYANSQVPQIGILHEGEINMLSFDQSLCTIKVTGTITLAKLEVNRMKKQQTDFRITFMADDEQGNAFIDVKDKWESEEASSIHFEQDSAHSMTVSMPKEEQDKFPVNDDPDKNPEIIDPDSTTPPTEQPEPPITPTDQPEPPITPTDQPEPPITPTDQPSEEKRNGVSIAIVIGVGIGGLVLGIVIGIIIVFAITHKRKNSNNANGEKSMPDLFTKIID